MGTQSSFFCIFAAVFGEMPEWSNGAVSKTVDLFGGPRVRIPFSPQDVETWFAASLHLFRWKQT